MEETREFNQETVGIKIPKPICHQQNGFGKPLKQSTLISRPATTVKDRLGNVTSLITQYRPLGSFLLQNETSGL
jgi:hypothetical protein